MKMNLSKYLLAYCLLASYPIAQAAQLIVSDQEMTLSNGDILTTDATHTNQSGNITLSSIATESVTFDSTANWEISGIISGSSKIKVNRNSTLTLSGNNTYSGQLELDAGTLKLTHQSALGTGTVKLAAGTTLIYDCAANATISGIDYSTSGNRTIKTGANAAASTVLTINGNIAAWSNANNRSLTIGDAESKGTIQFTGNMIFNRTGTLNAFQDTIVQGFTLSNNKSTVNLNVGDNKSLTLNVWGNHANGGGNVAKQGQGDLIIKSLDNRGAACTQLNISAGRLIFDISTANQTLGGVALQKIIGSGKVIKKGFESLSITAENTYTGGTEIQQGSIIAGHNNALGNGHVLINGGSLEIADGIALSTQSFQIDIANALSQDTPYITLGTDSSLNILEGGLSININFEGEKDQEYTFNIVSDNSGWTNESFTFTDNTNNNWELVSFDQTTGNLTMKAIPEPSSALLGLLGLSGILLRRKRKS